MPALAPLEVRCRFCGEVLKLNQDSATARESGTDPHQQLRRHLAGHRSQTVAAAQRFGWLIDMLCFRAESDPERWREQIHALAEYFLMLEDPL